MSASVEVKEIGFLNSESEVFHYRREERSSSSDYYGEKFILNSIDPTIITRLHSLLSGRDIFYLTNKHDYEVTFETPKIVSMKLPKSMITALLDVKVDIYTLTKYWYASEEVKLANWSYSKTKRYLESLTEFARFYKDGQKIFLDLAAS